MIISVIVMRGLPYEQQEAGRTATAIAASHLVGPGAGSATAATAGTNGGGICRCVTIAVGRVLWGSPTPPAISATSDARCAIGVGCTRLRRWFTAQTGECVEYGPQFSSVARTTRCTNGPGPTITGCSALPHRNSIIRTRHQRDGHYRYRRSLSTVAADTTIGCAGGGTVTPTATTTAAHADAEIRTGFGRGKRAVGGVQGEAVERLDHAVGQRIGGDVGRCRAGGELDSGHAAVRYPLITYLHGLVLPCNCVSGPRYQSVKGLLG